MTAAFAPPPGSVDDLTIDFKRGGNSDLYVGEGWSDPEEGHRWSLGQRSELLLPPIAEARSLVLTLECYPLELGGVVQELEVFWNGEPLCKCRPNPGVPFALAIPDPLVRAAGENALAFINPLAMAPADHDSSNGDTRLLAFAWTRLTLARAEVLLSERPVWLDEAAPPSGEDEARAIASAFQSLGQNCELGLFQRRCGAEPLSLLRFASIFPAALVQGLRHRFAGLEAANNLLFTAAAPGGELIGHHAIYGLDYHTFVNEGEVDVESFAGKDPRRLVYLARLLMEQLENNEKIFVRRGDFEADGETLALYQLLCGFNPAARLLIIHEAPPSAFWKVGRVERLTANLYRGYFSKFAESEDVPGTLPFDDWLKVCTTLYRYEQMTP